MKASYIPGQTNVDFFARNSIGQWWNGSAFETYNAANLVTYRIAATESPANSGNYQAADPTGAVEFELRLRASTLGSSVVVAGPAETDTAEATLRTNAATAATQATAAAVNAKQARQFFTNKRTRTVLTTRQWRYTVYEDDGTTEAFEVDFDPVTGNMAMV